MAVPLLLACALTLQVFWQSLQAPPVARADALPPAPPATIIRAASFGEPVAAAQLMLLQLQAFDNQPGISIPFADLDYGRVLGWLGPALAPTHWLAVPMSHSYPAPDIKQGPESPLFLNSRLTVTGEDKYFLRLADGRFVKKSHTLPLGSHLSDPAAVALQYLGVPYLWGGKSFAGLDCSGLVQLALHACGHQAPRDSCPQQALGVPVSGDLRRNDLVFWKGHVGILTAPDRLLHANGHHMQVREEPLAEAITRIGPAEAIRRLQ